MITTRSRPRHSRLTGVTYDMYLRLRSAPGNRGLRMAYNDGVLETMSPEFRHDKGARRIFTIVLAYCKAFDVPLIPAGATTFSRGAPGLRKGRGKEADESFYLREAVDHVADKETLDLNVDPPPSLWVEIDNWGSSRSRLPLYAGLKVPEVWRYRDRRRTLWFGRLSGEVYEEIPTSVALPGLSPAAVLGLLDEGRAQRNDTVWTRWLEAEWFPQHRQELIDGGAGR